MLRIKKSTKVVFSTILISFIVVLGLMGSSWNIGHAEDINTAPTIPVVYSITPNTICVGAGDTVATIRGEEFIDTTYTQVKWLDANYNYLYIIPDFVNVDGTELKFTIDAAQLSQVWIASVWVVNHPEVNDDEIVGPLYVDIIGCEFVYLPLIMK